MAVDDQHLFQVDIVQPGQTHNFTANPELTRWCSLASGKLQGRAEGEPKFIMGPRCMFVPKPGVACVAENRLYIDSVLHVSTFCPRHRGG